jgi:phenylacetate-CoA ligase
MSDRYWDTRMEMLPPERRAQFRKDRLHWQVRRCWDAAPFYRSWLEAAGIDPMAFGGMADWSRVSPLRASDLPDPEGDDPSEAWTVAPRAWWESREEVGESPTLVRILTDGDVVHCADRAARALWAAGARPGGQIRIAHAEFSIRFTIATTTAVIGAGSARIGTEPLLSSLEEADVAWSLAWPATANRARAGIEALSLPHLGSTVAFTCEAATGIHWADDHFLIEVVDPDTGLAVPVGSTGALVVTDLTREGSPLLRFWTGYETALVAGDPCACGRTSARSAFVRPLA